MMARIGFIAVLETSTGSYDRVELVQAIMASLSECRCLHGKQLELGELAALSYAAGEIRCRYFLKRTIRMLSGNVIQQKGLTTPPSFKRRSIASGSIGRL